MSVENTRREIIGLAANIGRSGLHYNWPNDFEYYALGLDLTDSDDRILDSLVFPVMPENIVEPRPSINSVKKTNTGVVSIYNTSFVPFDISVRGTFGRKLRILSNNGFNSFKKGSVVPDGEFEPKSFNTSIKTGYGTLKLLERIRDRSLTTDLEGRPTRLYYYNLALNSQFLVEFRNLVMQQDRQNNMIWYYTMNLKAIAPAFSIREVKRSSLISLLASDVLNKSLNSLVDNYRNTSDIRRNKKNFKTNRIT